MPENTFKLVMKNISHENKKVLVLGISYLEDVGDIRFSASEQLISMMSR